MSEKPRQLPVLSEHGKREVARRQARAAAALRANLQKRKQQSRLREDTAPPDDVPPLDERSEAQADRPPKR